MPGIDLHTHSTRSDGTFEPAELVGRAASLGLDVVALTDHDTTDGLAEARTAGVEHGVEVVPGIEFSAELDGTSVHVLCYWMDVDDAGLVLELARLRQDRLRRGEQMVERLRELGLPVAFERVREIAGDATIVRPHVAQAMVEAGLVGTEREAFDRYLGDGRPGHVAKRALDPVEAVTLITAAGGRVAAPDPLGGVILGDLPVGDGRVVVIGGGPAGENAVGRCAAGGLSVALVEGELVGGECSYWGCIPSKTLLRPGEALAEARQAPGAREAVSDGVDVPQALAWRDFMVADWDDTGQLAWLDGKGIELLRGEPAFTGVDSLVVGDRGSDIAAGAVILPAGTRLRPAAGRWGR